MASDRLRLVHFYGDLDENGNPHGLGLAQMEADMAYKDQAVCAGEWLHGRRHGRCMVSRPDSFRYLGDFVDDAFDGDGLLADFEEDVRQYGKFRCGEFVAGRGIKPKVIYEGQLGPDNKLCGYGFRQNINGLLTVGGFKGGKNHGVVFMRWQDGSQQSAGQDANYTARYAFFLSYHVKSNIASSLLHSDLRQASCL